MDGRLAQHLGRRQRLGADQQFLGRVMLRCAEKVGPQRHPAPRALGDLEGPSACRQLLGMEGRYPDLGCVLHDAPRDRGGSGNSDSPITGFLA
jgi:hypothetical protein